MRLFAKTVMFLIVVLSAVFIVLSQEVRALVEPYGYSLGEVTGLMFNLVLILGGYALWILKRTALKAGYDVRKAVLAVDLLGKGTLKEAAERFAAAHLETQKLPVLHFCATVGKDGQIVEADATKELQEWLNKNVIGQYGYVFALVGSPMATAVAYGIMTANLVDQNIFAFKSGRYESVLTVSKKVVGVGYQLTVAVQKS